MLPIEGNNERRIKWEVSKDFTNNENNVVGIPMLSQSFLIFLIFCYACKFEDNRSTSILCG